MAMPFIFNTLEYANKLVAAGVPKTQAEAQAHALHEALSEGTVTPGDMLILKTDLIVRIEVIQHGLELLTFKVEVLQQNLDNLKLDVDVLKQDVGVLKQDVGVLKQDVGVLKQDVGVLKQDVGVLKQDVDILKQDVGILNQDVTILKRKVGALIWTVAAVLLLQMAQLGTLVYIIGRLP